MPECYQISCENCEHPMEVEGRQAGGILECPQCEAKIDVPTFRVLKTLPVVDRPSRLAEGGDPNHLKGILFAAGLGLAVIAGVGGWFLYQHANKMVTENQVDTQEIETKMDEEIDSASISKLWDHWNKTIESVDLPDWKEASWKRYSREGNVLLNVSYAIMGVGALGFLAMCGSFFVPKTRSS